MEYIMTNSSGNEPAFLCPNCSLLAAHKISVADFPETSHPQSRLLQATCESCSGTSYIFEQYNTIEVDDPATIENIAWDYYQHSGYSSIRRFDGSGAEITKTQVNELILQRIIEPDIATGIPPVNDDLSTNVKKLYREAGSIMTKSPRASTALLRLALETMLTDDFGITSGSINSKIGTLYSNNIPEEIDTALHFLRIAGNAADHIDPGLIKLDGIDGENTVRTLFEVINYIAEDQITRKKKLRDLSRLFTPGQKTGIDALHKKVDNNKK